MSFDQEPDPPLHGECAEEIRRLNEQIESFSQTHVPRSEAEALRAWVNDLQSGMFINCVYCGHRYGPKDKVPMAMADVLKQHIEKCPAHPMSALKESLSDLRRVAGLLHRALQIEARINHVGSLRGSLDYSDQTRNAIAAFDQIEKESGRAG